MGGTSSGMQDPLEAGQFDPSLYDYKLIQALEQQAIPPVQSLPVGAVNTVVTSNEEATHSTVLQDPLEAVVFLVLAGWGSVDVGVWSCSALNAVWCLDGTSAAFLCIDWVGYCENLATELFEDVHGRTCFFLHKHHQGHDFFHSRKITQDDWKMCWYFQVQIKHIIWQTFFAWMSF